MRSEQGFRFFVFGSRMLNRKSSPLSVQLTLVAASFQISNLKSQIRAAQGGRL